MAKQSIESYINKIHCADCLDIMNQLPDNCVDLCLCDLPYNIGIDIWDKIDNYVNWFVIRAKAIGKVIEL